MKPLLLCIRPIEKAIMKIIKGKKIKKVDNLTALYKDIKAVEKVSKFGAFILAYNLLEAIDKGRRKEIKKLFNGLSRGYSIPKNFSLIWGGKKKNVVIMDGKTTIVDLKEFIRIAYRKYNK